LALQIRQQGISVLFLTTALFQQIAREVPGAFAELRYLLFGGEAVSCRWVQKILKNKPPKHLLHVYGPTECTTFSTCYWVQSVPESATTIPIGSPISNTEIYLLDEQLQPVPIGVTGELYIGGDKLARGYLNRPELSAERFIPHPFSDREGASLYKTGDLARYLADGNVEFIGRRDEQVKIRGFRIELGEIEAVLSQHPAVARAVVIIWEEVPGDKQLVAYVVPIEQLINPKSFIQNPKSTELRQFLKQKLPGYMVPSAYVVLESLPLTPNGKVNRHLLPEPDTFSRDIQEDYIAPRNSVEEVLVGIWAKVLGVEQVSVCDNFFELGGHSLLATQLISRIRDAFQVELTVRNLFEAPTVAGLARYIETIGWAAQGADTARSAIAKREEVEF
jgi:acyl-CoA synthetase (AMP-forming)/AMP-acid ligase II/acyl carrier protein